MPEPHNAMHIGNYRHVRQFRTIIIKQKVFSGGLTGEAELTGCNYKQSQNKERLSLKLLSNTLSIEPSRIP